jgi:hypothetical protein
MAPRQPHALLGAHRSPVPATGIAKRSRRPEAAIDTIFGIAIKTNFKAFSIGSRQGRRIVMKLGKARVFLTA